MKLWRSLLATVLTVMLILSMSVSAFAYTDVPESDGYYEFIHVVDSLGLIPANNVGDFSPKNYYTRGDALITAYRMINGSDEGLEDYASDMGLFEDVDENHPVLPYLNWAYDNSLITNELEERLFKPADPISGAEFLTLFVKVGNIDPTAAAGGEGGEGGEGMESTEATEGTESTEGDGFESEATEGEEGTEAGGDGEGTTTGEIVYPDSYVDAAYDFAGDIYGDEETITRDMAAMAIAQLLWYQDSDTAIDLSTLEDDQGNRLDCFATNVYGLSKVTLHIRGTANRDMGYDFDGDVLLSNGNVMETDEDLSKYIGHPVVVTYRDMDRSGTLTEDEEIISYTLNSMMILNPTLPEIALSDYTKFVVSNIGLSFNITSATRFYYNDRIWDENPLNNLITIAGGVGASSIISNRPNMVFTVVPSEIFDADSGENLVLEVFVEEHHPAKIVDSSDGTLTLYDYYARGTDAEYVQFNMSNIEFKTASSAVGDYVNFYTAGDTCYILDGSAIKTTITSVGAGNTLNLEDGTVLTPHQLYKRSNTIPQAGEEMIIITEDVAKTHYLSWEYPTALEKTPAMIISLTENMDSVSYVLYDCASASQITIEVPMDNIFATSRIEAGEFIYYSMDAAEQYSVVRANISDKVKLGVETEDYFVESSTGKIYNKSKYYYGNLYTDTFKEDYYKMILDVSGNVLALM